MDIANWYWNIRTKNVSSKQSLHVAESGRRCVENWVWLIKQQADKSEFWDPTAAKSSLILAQSAGNPCW